MTDATTPPYEQWTVRELRDELRTRNLSTSGSQSDLAARLSDSDREPADLTVAELKDELREQDLPVSGTKDELVGRLEGEHVTQTSEQQARSKARIAGACVVNGGRGFHVGRAVNGKVCSYHAMHYLADGTPR